MSQPPKDGGVERCSIAAVPLEVVTVTAEEVVVAVPVALIEAGLNWQAAPAGSPEQASVMVPLKPVEEETEIEVEPEEPGAETVTPD